MLLLLVSLPVLHDAARVDGMLNDVERLAGLRPATGQRRGMLEACPVAKKVELCCCDAVLQRVPVAVR